MVSAIDYALWIPVLPIVAFPIILFLGNVFKGMPAWRGRWKEGGTIATIVIGTCLGLSIWLIVGYIGQVTGHESVGQIGDWLSFHMVENGNLVSYSLGFGMYLDHVSVMLLFVASFLCFLIAIFSLGYMNSDPVNLDRNHRFYAEFLLFCAGMLGMVLADNFLWLFIFWEIMGLCSYLLIGFYYERPSASYAAKKAFLTTRVGDIFLLIGLLILWNLFGSLDFSVVWAEDNIAAVDAGTLKIALFMMFVGAVGKSAQFPLHVWLPDAMEGPTPVSALIHAATMVNAGLYLVARMFPFFASPAMAGEFTDLAMLIAWIGGITAFMAALIAFVQMDIKKVLAYSTMSQLAYIFTGLGAALWFANTGHEEIALLAFGASMFHLFNHAMAKGMLFMASGSVIHEMHHVHHEVAHHDSGKSAAGNAADADHDGGQGGGDDHDHFDAQDMSNMGGLASKMPITATAMAVGSASIIGIPLIGGFWSKEGIIGAAWKASLTSGGAWMLGPALLLLITAGMTGFYMSRMWFMTFAGKPNTPVANGVVEQTPFIPIPLITLTVVTLGGIVFAGFEFVHWVADGHAEMHFTHVLSGIGSEMKHAFLPSGEENGALIFLVTMLTIIISTIVGPATAMALYGGRLQKGEKAKPWLAWLVSLSSRVRRNNHFDNSIWANSGLADSLHQRLHFDAWYDAAMLKIVVPFANACAWFDQHIIDGAIKGIEYGSQEGSSVIRRLTTGSGRDYIMMVALGTLAIFVLIWGVA
ncbi:MAG: hypothetical protein CXX80_11930 [Methanobacteriota archaeon]|nr:MAG: hypothetical protein CXX80_11930 [Euryarchaeota archaeon]